MRFDVLCLLPEIVEAATGAGVLGGARAAGLIEVACVNPRDYAGDPRGAVDDRPYGGGPGMVLRYGPLARAHAAARAGRAGVRTVALTPDGARFDQAAARAAAAGPDLILVAGRYAGIDERFLERRTDAQWSLGDYVLSGGELAAAAVIDAVARFVPGVLGDAESAARDSFADGLLGHPHYTRPEEVDGLRVPGVLLSGNHGRIERWRRQQALVRTRRRRPDLLARRALSAAERALLDEIPDAAGEEADRERDD